jgi:hypothetical protein
LGGTEKTRGALTESGACTRLGGPRSPGTTTGWRGNGGARTAVTGSGWSQNGSGPPSLPSQGLQPLRSQNLGSVHSGAGDPDQGVKRPPQAQASPAGRPASRSSPDRRPGPQETLDGPVSRGHSRLGATAQHRRRVGGQPPPPPPPPQPDGGLRRRPRRRNPQPQLNLLGGR